MSKNVLTKYIFIGRINLGKFRRIHLWQSHKEEFLKQEKD